MIIKEEKRMIVREIIVYICKCEICGAEFESKWGDPCCSQKCYQLFREGHIQRNIKLSTLRKKENKQ